MLRIENQCVRIVLLILAFIGLALFLLPLLFHIVNIGNMFGTAVSATLLAYVVFNRQIADFVDTLWQKQAGKIGLIVLASIVALGVLYCLIISCFMLYYAHRKPKNPPQAVIVLGCKVRGTEPSLMLSRRIKAAYAVLAENPAMVAVVSGGQGENELISEAECMANTLIKMGIAPERILMEDRSTSTSENLRFSKEILEANGLTGSLLLATDGFHEMRAQMLAKKENLPECGAVSAHTSWYLVPTYWVREWFGLVHAFVFEN